MLACPFVVKLVDHQEAIFVAQLDELAAVGVVRGTYMVDAELLHQLQALLDGTGIVGCTECTEGVVVGIALEQHFLAVEFQSETWTNLNCANAKLSAHLVGHCSVFPQERSHNGVEIRVLGIPQLCIGNLYFWNQVGQCACGHVALAGTFPLKDRLSVRSYHLHLHVDGFRLGVVRELCCNVDKAIVACGDVEWMAGKIKVFGCGDEFHVAEQTATGIPSRVVRLAGVGNNGQFVGFSPLQLVGDVNLKAHISVVGAANALSVEIDIARVHDAAKVEQDALALHVVGRSELITVVAFAHLLESATRQAALDVGCHIGVVGLLVSGRSHPWLFNLEVVWQVYLAPLSFVVQSEFPSEG